MAKPLVIVESPAKARTIARYLGDDFVVESSIGHIRDLPRDASDVPAAYKGESWARLGVDVDNGFKPLYVLAREKKDQVAKLKRLVRAAEEVYLATDEDREGESIAWHLQEVLSPQVPVRRMVFHEITRPAIQRALAEPRELDRRLVDAQETRRILDRLVGYEVSPVLWKKVMPRLSAGRVQSVATRIVVERERARMRFRPAGWWDLEGTCSPRRQETEDVVATLVAVDGTRLATGRDFTEAGELVAGRDVAVLDQARAGALAESLQGVEVTVRSVERKPYRRRPAAPFITSTLQQEAARKLNMSAAQSMRVAQSLYEGGYITYMRTDSTTLSEDALAAARGEVEARFGSDFLADRPRRYKGKVKNAQEAHEAIRPAGDRFRAPGEVAGEVGRGAARLYELVWQRTLASQMADAVGETVTLRLGGRAGDGTDVELAASGTVVTFAGYQRAYVEGHDGDGEEAADGRRLPALSEGDVLDVTAVEARGHETSPPSRFTEASLVKRMEELGVGRPSTYAAIMGTIQDRGYVWKRGSALVPSFVAFAVVTLLEQHFPDLVDYAFTALMEDDLDGIAAGSEESVPWLSRFYFGQDGGGLKRMVSDHLGDIDAREINSIPIGTDPEGREVVARVGRYGPYVQRGEDTSSLPEDLPPDELTLDRAAELLEAPSGDRRVGEDPETGLVVLARSGRYGPYVQLGEADEGAKTKPRTSSLFGSMSLDTVTLDDALRLLGLPRVVGVDPSDGEEIVANNGRYGPYLKKGKETRSLDAEEQLLTIGLDEALGVLAQPKRRGGQRAAPLQELGQDPGSGRPVVLKEGRFGPYVTDGETNASLRTGDAVETVSLERAAELLEERRAKGPATKSSTAKKSPAKKSPAKKSPAKKSPAKKSPAKKSTAKRSMAKKSTAKKRAKPRTAKERSSSR